MKNSPTILVVKIDSIFSEKMRNAAQLKGFRVVQAQDGQECLDKAKAEPPDIVIIPDNAPVLDGASTSVLLKESEHTKSIPVIIVCTSGSCAELERCKDAGCDAYLEKDVSPEELIKQIEEWL